eukprot:1028935-Pelagomonas_calceolata.AAC.1
MARCSYSHWSYSLSFKLASLVPLNSIDSPGIRSASPLKKLLYSCCRDGSCSSTSILRCWPFSPSLAPADGTMHVHTCMHTSRLAASSGARKTIIRIKLKFSVHSNDEDRMMGS